MSLFSRAGFHQFVEALPGTSLVLTSMEGIDQAPYFAKRKWVSVSAEAALSAEDVEEYLRRSYGLVGSGLTRKLRLELGIPVDEKRR
jgi:predicted DNA-binding protein (MmcQ/YjbR family)